MYVVFSRFLRFDFFVLKTIESLCLKGTMSLKLEMTLHFTCSPLIAPPASNKGDLFSSVRLPDNHAARVFFFGGGIPVASPFGPG